MQDGVRGEDSPQRRPGAEGPAPSGGFPVVLKRSGQPLRALSSAARMDCPLGFDKGYNDAALLALEAASTRQPCPPSFLSLGFET